MYLYMSVCISICTSFLPKALVHLIHSLFKKHDHITFAPHTLPVVICEKVSRDAVSLEEGSLSHPLSDTPRQYLTRPHNQPIVHADNFAKERVRCVCVRVLAYILTPALTATTPVRL